MNKSINEKIQEINYLNENIDRIQSFINLAVKAQEIDEKHAEINEFNGVNRFVHCEIGARISTGSQSPKYEQVILSDDVIRDLMAGGLELVKSNLKEKERRLNQLLK